MIGTLDTSGSALGVVLSADGNTAYVADYSSDLQIIDVSDSNTPTPIRTFATAGFAQGVTLSSDGNTAYVAGAGSGLQIVDMSDSNAPT